MGDPLGGGKVVLFEIGAMFPGCRELYAIRKISRGIFAVGTHGWLVHRNL